MKIREKLSLESAVDKIKGVGHKYSEIFGKKKIKNIFDLLQIFPFFYIDFSKPETAFTDISGVYEAKVLTINGGRNFRRRISILRVNLLILEKKVEVVFFNQPYLKNSLNKNDIIYIYGKVGFLDSKYSMVNPVISSENSKRVLPVYKNIGTIKQGIIKKIILSALENLAEGQKDILPDFIVKRHSFYGLLESFKNIHKPDSSNMDNIDKSRERFKYSEFLFFQLELQFLRQLLLRKRRVFRYKFTKSQDSEVKKRLEFSLTKDQLTAYSNIKKALSEPYSMAALLHGDVGSGKTIIAFLTILIAVVNGFQGAILVPTEVLAFQHLKTGKAFFHDYNVEVLTGSMSNSERNRIIKDLQTGKINIIIGTHSLINEGIKFKDLAMIIIDEQHKFGVSQRASLFYKSRGVDLLVMTATPIPRTMLLSVYNDLKIFSIKEKPKDRKLIKTKIIPLSDRDQFYKWLRSKIEDGEKAYIILPLIENSEFFSDLHSIEGERGFIKECFKPFKVGIISGKVEKEDRDRILQKFKQGSLSVILSTTVIEVGIDVKDATIIVIEDADRYGLAGIHQLRGRVGRGENQSFCYLIPSKKISESGKERLITIEKENDGFKIAEIDLKIRGGGIIAGISQSGDLNFKNGNIRDDLKLYDSSKEDASNLLKNLSLSTEHIKEYLLQIKKKSKFLNFS